MARLKHPGTVPPAPGYAYLQRESRLTIHGESRDDLVARVIQHRQHKGYEPTDKATVTLEVERQICSRLGKDWCKAEGIDDEWIPMPDGGDFLNWNKVKSFSAAAWEWLKQGGELAPLDEAKARAAICGDCPACQPWGGCRACGLSRWTNEVVPKDRQFSEVAGRGCAVCSCALGTLVNAPASVILAAEAERPLTYAKGCWKIALIANAQK